MYKIYLRTLTSIQIAVSCLMTTYMYIFNVPLAPLDANTLAKLANGLCDNLLTCICRAWDFSKPILFAPAMNTFMWEHPITATHINVIQSWGYEQIPPIEKVLMCKDKGLGAMAEPDTIVKKVIDTLNKR